MKVYERIKFLRKQQNMSQQELADKIGYKDKSAISKVERGDRDISQSLLIKYAEALHTTPAYLMGWEEEPRLPIQDNNDKNDEKKELLNRIAQMDEDQLRQLNDFADYLIDKKK